ncbi:hypothetical protein PCCS19_34740 [Paenibacillus sp. CCS19]|uniref:hypothetical protein n=1 Tax=Paenibacillus sp. CCS19 TaxID=3158387 RepID=UPI00256266B1|nr:hypothetical protein [Paenibacillus cellulosilyticus]GMK40418.1 hypothetical protein PCCS19_34740 [Paenibacillus cellulosilyticus]
MYFRMNMLLLVFVTSMMVLFGCTNNDDNLSTGAIVKEDHTVDKENKIEILGLTNGIRKVNSSQLNQITKNMTYEEVMDTLGNTKDIGSGIWIFRYEFENGKFFDLNTEHGPKVQISEEDYQDIQNMLSN